MSAPRRTGLVWVVVSAVVGAAPAVVPPRVAALNDAFVRHLETLGPQQAAAVAQVRAGLPITDDAAAAGFVPEALSVLYPRYRDGMAAFDAERYDEAARCFQPLAEHADPFLAANSAYFLVRIQVERGRLEEAERLAAPLLPRMEELAEHTPFAAQLAMLAAYAQAANLNFASAQAALRQAGTAFPDAPEAVRIGARQLLLELERREVGTLAEVADYMGYSSARLKVQDAQDRVRERQDQIIALLDKMIEKEEQQEQQQGGGRGSSGGRERGSPRQAPSAPREESATPEGGAQIGDLHGAPPTDPAQMWGKLPPAEREKILQSLRERFPSRYRQLVEQYYRSLAEQK